VDCPGGTSQRRPERCYKQGRCLQFLHHHAGSDHTQLSVRNARQVLRRSVHLHSALLGDVLFSVFHSVCLCVCLSAETAIMLLLFRPLIELGDFCVTIYSIRGPIKRWSSFFFIFTLHDIHFERGLCRNRKDHEGKTTRKN